MEFFCYHRDRPGSVPSRDALLSEHWSYMDTYQAEMIARGPTLADDGTAWLGTAVLVQARDPDTAASILAADQYASVEVHRWQPGGRD
jgi:uncharacterized protein YciI